MQSDLTPESVREFVARIREDTERRDELIALLQERGFRHVVAETFTLNEHQNRELEVMTKDLDEIASLACIMALENEGSIEYVDERHHPANMAVEVYCKISGECGVRFRC